MGKLSPRLQAIFTLAILVIFVGSVELGASPYLPQPQGGECIPLYGVCKAPSGIFSSPLADRPILNRVPELLWRSEQFFEARLPDITTLLPVDQGAAFLSKILVKTSPRFL